MANNLLSGALAGAAATLPMTALMEASYRALPRREQEPLPPRVITERMLDTVGAKELLDRDERYWLTLAGHFGYGAGCGALWAVATRGRRNSPAAGILYGSLVWAVSYLGWLPRVGLYRHAAQDSAGRNSLMVAAHWVWGASLAALLKAHER